MWTIYDYLKSGGRNDIEKWTLEQTKERRARLIQKVDVIRKNGTDVPTEILADLGGGIYKLKVKGNPQLRPLLCRGVVDNDSEFTFLIGAIEKGGDYEPKDAVDRARERYADLLEHPTQRCRHKDIT